MMLCEPCVAARRCACGKTYRRKRRACSVECERKAKAPPMPRRERELAARTGLNVYAIRVRLRNGWTYAEIVAGERVPADVPRDG